MGSRRSSFGPDPDRRVPGTPTSERSEMRVYERRKGQGGLEGGT